MMRIEKTYLDDVIVIHSKIIGDERGFFMEAWRRDEFKSAGLDLDFVQDNHSRSRINTVRGLHFQWEPAMGKLMRVTRGKAFLVAVDIRKNSTNLGKWIGFEVSEDDKRQIWAPAGFARGFAALSEIVDIQYKCTGTYNNKCESGILWNDPKVGIKWPIENPLLSDKDTKAQTLDKWLECKFSKELIK